MRTQKLAASLAATTVAITLTLAGCSTKASTSSSDGGSGGGAGGVKTDVGVTSKEITLGALTDTSGVFKVLGLGITQGNQLWAQEVNKAGGICGRQIKVITADSGYSADKAVPLYNQMRTKELGMIQLLGSPILAAIKKPMVDDKMAAIPSSWASTNLDVPNVVMVGPTYDVEMINGMSYLQKEGKIKDGDTVGHIYVDSEYGKNGLLGSKHYASEHKMKLVEASVTSTETDLTSAITKLKAQGVKAIMLTTTPAQTGSALGVMKAQGLNVPVYGSGPTFTPQLLDTPVASVLTSGQFITSALTVPYNSTLPKAKAIAANWEQTHPDQVATFGPIQGYAFGLVWGSILKQACSDGDLTRAGVLAAVRKTTVDTQGLTPSLDFTKPGEPSTRESVMLQPAKVPGGLKLIGDGNYESADAKSYKLPFQGK